MYVASPLQPAFPADQLASEQPGDFSGVGGLTLTSSVPIVKAALTVLGEIWPMYLSCEALCGAALQRLGIEVTPAGEAMARYGPALTKSLLTAYAKSQYRLVNLSVSPPAFTLDIPRRPCAYSLARYQARHGPLVTNLRHESVQLSPLDQQLLTCLDGTRDIEGMLATLVDGFRREEIRLNHNEQPVTDEARAAEILLVLIPQRLEALARAALLCRVPVSQQADGTAVS